MVGLLFVQGIIEASSNRDRRKRVTIRSRIASIVLVSTSLTPLAILRFPGERIPGVVVSILLFVALFALARRILRGHERARLFGIGWCVFLMLYIPPTMLVTTAEPPHTATSQQLGLAATIVVLAGLTIHLLCQHGHGQSLDPAA